MSNHYLLSKLDLSEDMQCTELSPLIEALRDSNKHFVINNERPADMNVEEVMEVYIHPSAVQKNAIFECCLREACIDAVRSNIECFGK